MFYYTDEKVIYCHECAKEVNCSKKYRLNQHMNTALHQSNSSKKRNNVQTFLNQRLFNPEVNNFSLDLCQALLAANIPWYKVERSKFREFLRTYTKTHVIAVKSEIMFKLF